MRDRDTRNSQDNNARTYETAMPHHEIPQFPDDTELERLKRVRRFPGRNSVSFQLEVEFITPRIGGSVRPREVGETLRPSSLRGMWRQWWRALQPLDLRGARLAAAETRVWGGMGQRENGAVRSPIEIVGVRETREAQPSKRDWVKEFNYALWPFAENKKGQDVLQPAGLRQRFQIDLDCREEYAVDLERTLLAWLSFGGYGGRTRRGLGAVAPVRFLRDGQAVEAMPPSEKPAEVAAFLSRGLGLQWSAPAAADSVVRLQGATLMCGSATKDPVSAWRSAIDALREFRQGVPFARQSGRERPGRSHWPEPDRLRRLAGQGPWAHPPRFGRAGGFPRAAFGLPIQTRFQTKDRDGRRYFKPEPDMMKLEIEGSDRLASATLFRPLAIANGNFLPIVLWLNRNDSDLELKIARGALLGAHIDDLLARQDQAPPDDKGLFSLLQQAQQQPRGLRMRSAFCKWLHQHKEFQRVFG